MSSANTIQHFGNLIIQPYTSSDITPLLPILHQEFPKWDENRIDLTIYMVIIIINHRERVARSIKVYMKYTVMRCRYDKYI